MKRRYDTIVIGSGLAGLVAAATIARGGLAVLLVEQADTVGGYAHAFRRGPYVFDPALHVMGEVRDGEAIDVIFRHLGVREQLTFIETHALFDLCLPGFAGRVPIGTENFLAAHVDWFPDEALGIRRLVALCTEIHREAHELPPQLSLRDLDWAAQRFPTLFAYQRRTIEGVIRELVKDPLPNAVLGASWAYLGTPPSRLSALTFAQLLAVWGRGVFAVHGGFQAIVDALRQAFQATGGELVLGARADRILLRNGQVRGVELADGSRFESATVISNAAARTTLLDMVGSDRLPRGYVRRLRNMEPSVSAFTVFGSTTHDLSASDVLHDTLVYKHVDHDKTYREMQAGRPATAMIKAPTTLDPSLAPEGEHVVVIVAPVHHDIGRAWKGAKQRFTDELLRLCDVARPGLADWLDVQDVATPETYAGYTSNERGAMHGWASTPEHAGSRRLAIRTPIEGLYLAGHWTQPGSGSIRVLVSGFVAAQAVLQRAGAPVPTIPLATDASWEAYKAGVVEVKSR